MIYCALPVGSNFGWGVCGKNATLEMSRLRPVTLFAEPFGPEQVGDFLEYLALMSVSPSPEVVARVQHPGGGQLDGPLLQCISSKLMTPMMPQLRGMRTVGYTFFEDNLLPPISLQNARHHFDHVATGCGWCTDTLRELGLTNVSTVVQGIDPEVFHATPTERRFFRDRFVIFSGGKFEFRKGQDLVIRAVRVLQERYSDVFLLASWWNAWQFSIDTMRASSLIRFQPSSKEYGKWARQVLTENGIRQDRALVLPPLPNINMAKVYKQTDLGLFPNRCEGGTNLVMMEYMASGKPVVASYSSGHKDLLTAENSWRVMNMNKVEIRDESGPIARWDDPSLDEVVAHLDDAYHDRAERDSLGRRAGEDLRQYTWQRTAQEFLKLLEAQS